MAWPRFGPTGWGAPPGGPCTALRDLRGKAGHGRGARHSLDRDDQGGRWAADREGVGVDSCGQRPSGLRQAGGPGDRVRAGHSGRSGGARRSRAHSCGRARGIRHSLCDRGGALRERSPKKSRRTSQGTTGTRVARASASAHEPAAGRPRRCGPPHVASGVLTRRAAAHLPVACGSGRPPRRRCPEPPPPSPTRASPLRCPPASRSRAMPQRISPP